MFFELKLFLIVIKVIGFFPIKNVFRKHGSRLEVPILSLETLAGILLKCLIHFTFVTGMLRDRFYTLIPAIIFSVISEVQLLFIVLPRAVDCIRMSENFDRRKLTSITKSRKRRYFWFISMLFELILVSFLNFLTSPAILFFELQSKLLFVWIIFPIIFKPRVYVAVCNELTRRFQILNEIYAEVCDLMNENEALFFCDPRLFAQRIESIRLGYAHLSGAADLFIQGSNFPVAFHFILLFMECGAHIYGYAILDHKITVLQVYRMLHWCYVIFTIAHEYDRLKNAVGMILHYFEESHMRL